MKRAYQACGFEEKAFLAETHVTFSNSVVSVDQEHLLSHISGQANGRMFNPQGLLSLSPGTMLAG
jgi:hypothetical protein